jgi:hypothetical protein
MTNFNFLLERLSNINDEEKYNDEKIKELIKLGNKIDDSFWINFLMVLNKTDSFSILFEIPEEKISKIYRKIKKYLKNEENNENMPSNKTRKLI